jgi:hypothetical protein
MSIFQPLALIIIDDNISQFRTSPLPCMGSLLDVKVFPKSLFATELNRILGVDADFEISARIGA